MASFNIHLAIAKLYAERNGIKDTAAFFEGTIDPDLTDNKDDTHYGFTPASFENAWVRVINKVNLAKFLANNPINNYFNLGKFLHLVTDQKFFHEFIGEKILTQEHPELFNADLYHSYTEINPYLIQRYNLKEIKIDTITNSHFMKEKIKQAANKVNEVKNGFNYSPKNIIDIKRLNKFINDVANIDLENIAKHVHNFSSL